MFIRWGQAAHFSIVCNSVRPFFISLCTNRKHKRARQRRERERTKDEERTKEEERKRKRKRKRKRRRKRAAGEVYRRNRAHTKEGVAGRQAGRQAKT